MSLKQQAFSGVKWTTVATVTTAGLQLVQVIILARILNPTDFGLIALVMVVIGFSQMFIDMGVSNAIIYKQKISIEQLSTLYWLNIIIGLLLFFVIVIFSPFISTFYENNELTPLIKLVAVTFLIKPWGQQFMVLLQKNMQFNAIAKTDITSRLISFSAVVVLAFSNFGVYSLAIGSVINAIFSTLGYNYYGRNLYKPKFSFRIQKIKEFLNFGLFQVGEKIIHYFSSQFDTLLIGKLLGIEVLGFYNVAKELVSKPSGIINPVVTKVTFPLMAKFNDNIARLKNVFLKTVNILSFINFPVYFLITVLAKPIILIMFGHEWESAIDIVQVLSLTFLARSIGNPTGNLLLSRGKANIAFYWNLIIFVLYPISILVGSFWGIMGITYASLFLQLFLLYPIWKYIVFKTCNAGFLEFFGSFNYSFFISLVSLSITFLFISSINDIFSKLIIGFFVYILSFILLLYLLQPNVFQEFKNFALNKT